MRRTNPVIAIIVSFFLAFLLSALPLPEALAAWRPAWVALVLIFWVLNAPEYVGFTIAFIVGVLLDALLGSVFGMHSLVLCVMVYLVRLSHRWVGVFSAVQTSGLVFALVFVGLLIKLIIEGVVSDASASFSYWLPTISSAVLWPSVLLVLGRWGRRF